MTSSQSLVELLAGLPVEVPADAAGVTVVGIAHDSRRVLPGDLFVATAGERFDGRDFATDAVGRGAVAVLAAGPPAAEAPAVPWVTTQRGTTARSLLAPLAARVYRHPDRELTTIGVTGTNGKSTVATLAAAVLEAAGEPSGLLSSLDYRFGGWSLPAERTTPEASDLFRLLRRMRDDGAQAVAMEVSSHALELGRVAEMSFDVAVFTNLTRDHLDFHGDLERYFAAKRRLFTERLAPGGRAVVNVDDAWGQGLARELAASGGPLVTFGENGQVRPQKVTLDEKATVLTVTTPRGELEVRSRLLGRYNAWNLLAAVAVGEALDLPHAAVRQGIGRVGPIPGRMEPVDRGQPFPVFIDYSHTDAALEAALLSLRELSGRRIIVVFGCGGDRDPGKRPLMGRVAGELADLPIVTSDNPRSEDPLEIISAVEEGLKESGNPRYRVVPDRREAIRRAIAVAGPEDAVLIAGKGNEEIQVVGDETRRFRDREEIELALEAKLGSTQAD